MSNALASFDKKVLQPVTKFVDRGVIRPVVKAVDNVIVKPIGQALTGLDKTVRKVVPGGWQTVGTLAAAVATPYAAAWLSKASGMSALAATTTVGAGVGGLSAAAGGGNAGQILKGAALGGLLAGGLKAGSDYLGKAATANFGAADFIAEDALNLSKQGLGQQQIADTLMASGVERGPALSAASFAHGAKLNGMSATNIANQLSSSFGKTPMFTSEAISKAGELVKSGQYVTPELEKLPSSVMDKLPATPAGGNAGTGLKMPGTSGSFGTLTPPSTGVGSVGSVGSVLDDVISTPAGWSGSGLNPALPQGAIFGTGLNGGEIGKAYLSNGAGKIALDAAGKGILMADTFGSISPVIPKGMVTGTGLNGGEIGKTYLDNGLGQVAKDAAGKPILAQDTFGQLTAQSGGGTAATLAATGLANQSGGALGTPLSGAATGGAIPGAGSSIPGAIADSLPGILNSVLTGGLALGAGALAKNAIDLGPVGSGQAQVNYSPVASTMPQLAQGGLNPGHMLDAVQPYTGQMYDYSKKPYMADMPALQNYIQQQQVAAPVQPAQPIQQQAFSAQAAPGPVAPQGANPATNINADDIMRELALLQQYA